MTRRDALLAAVRTLLRPIIMTTVAMIFGMLPLASVSAKDRSSVHRWDAW